MNPPTEQLVRDYLNRVSVAARGRLSAEDRRAFLARTREFIDANTRALGHTDSADVLNLLSDLGDPAGLVDRERDRLADQRAGSGAGGVGSPFGSAGPVGSGAPPGDPASAARPSARARRWRPAKASLADLMAARAAAVPPGRVVPVPEPAPDVPLTGELQFQTRPITSRWRPGAPMMPKPPRQRRAGIPRRLQSDDAPLDDGPAGGAPAGGAPPGSAASDGLVSDGLVSDGGSSGDGPPGEAEERRAAAAPPDAAADQQSAESPHGAASRQPRLRRPEWPLVSPRRPDASVGVGANGQQPPGGADAHMSGQAHSNGAQSGGEQLNGAADGAPANGAAPDAIGPSATASGGTEPRAAAEPDGADSGSAASGGAVSEGPEPGGAEPPEIAAGSLDSGGAQSDGGPPGGTRPAWPQAGVIPAQRISGDDAQPSEAPPSLPQASGQSPGPPQPQPTSADTGIAGADSGDVPETAGVSSSELVAGRAPGSRRLAAVARGSGWASGVRARGARLAGARRPGRGTGAGGAGAGGAGSAGGNEPDAQDAQPDSLDSQPGRPAEDPLSGLWPDLGPIGAGAAKLARTVLARARRRPLEATAIVLLGLGGLIYPPVWLIGAAVALASRVWDFRDKWIGLAVPVFLVIIGMVADVSLGGNRSGLGGYIREAWIFGGHLSRLVAVLSAVYLAWRAERGRRSPPAAPWNKPRRFG
jgi:hypothetical protein